VASKPKVVWLREPDPVFFPKDSISVGTRFGYHGALGRSEWEVHKIVTLLRDRGVHREEERDDVRILKDVVHLRRTDGPLEMRRATFSYLRYSAIWRLK
jgi:hypothetical protein